tara:strand:- start:467 stop:937 length:471 start_codon:yes stop_codon:yes gene_type:complete
MAVKAAAFLGVVFAGCASGVPPQYRTHHGFSVYGPAYSRAEVELATHAVLLAADAPDRKNQFRNCTIEYVEGPFECSASASGLCAGMHWPTRCRLLVSRLGDCVADSATVHELVHLIAWETGEGRVEHTNQKWFAGSGSVESRAGQIAADYCDGKS